MMSILLMLLGILLRNGALKKDDDEEPHVIVLSNRDTRLTFLLSSPLEAIRVYNAVQVLYQLLSTLCCCYCSNAKHAAEILPAIVLGFHFLVLNHDLFLVSTHKSATCDQPALDFAAACAPFFTRFQHAQTVECATAVEDADLSAVNEEYADCAGVTVLSDLLVGVCEEPDE